MTSSPSACSAREDAAARKRRSESKPKSSTTSGRLVDRTTTASVTLPGAVATMSCVCRRSRSRRRRTGWLRLGGEGRTDSNRARERLLANRRLAPRRREVALGRHCDRRSARARARKQSWRPGQPTPQIGRLRRAARIARSLAWCRRSDPQQAVEDLSENPPDACSRPPNRLSGRDTIFCNAGRAAAPRSPGTRLPLLLKSSSGADSGATRSEQLSDQPRRGCSFLNLCAC